MIRDVKINVVVIVTTLANLSKDILNFIFLKLFYKSSMKLQLTNTQIIKDKVIDLDE